MTNKENYNLSMDDFIIAKTKEIIDFDTVSSDDTSITFIKDGKDGKELIQIYVGNIYTDEDEVSHFGFKANFIDRMFEDEELQSKVSRLIGILNAENIRRMQGVK